MLAPAPGHRRTHSRRPSPRRSDSTAATCDSIGRAPESSGTTAAKAGEVTRRVLTSRPAAGQRRYPRIDSGASRIDRSARTTQSSGQFSPTRETTTTTRPANGVNRRSPSRLANDSASASLMGCVLVARDDAQGTRPTWRAISRPWSNSSPSGYRRLARAGRVREPDAQDLDEWRTTCRWPRRFWSRRGGGDASPTPGPRTAASSAKLKARGVVVRWRAHAERNGSLAGRRGAPRSRGRGPRSPAAAPQAHDQRKPAAATCPPPKRRR